MPKGADTDLLIGLCLPLKIAGVKKKVTNSLPINGKFTLVNVDKPKPKAIADPNTKKYWEEIVLDLIEVNSILKNQLLN